jgi:Fur family transcriptional regulator, ferric uptake regulator
MDYQLLELLRQSELRNTPVRQTVFQALKAGPAVSIQELYQKIGEKLDRASMYRTLGLFRELGVIQDVVIAGQRKVELTDRFSNHHHHIACAVCGKTVAIHDSSFETHIEQLAKANGFTHRSHSFEITGICESCHRSDGVARV